MYQSPHHGNSFLSFGGFAGGWKKLGSIAADESSLELTNIPNKRYYKFLFHTDAAADYLDQIRLGSGAADLGQNYAWRRSLNDATENSATNQTSVAVSGFSDSAPHYGYGFIANHPTYEKSIINYAMTAAGAGSGITPQRSMTGGKWSNLQNALDVLRLTTASATDYTGSELVLLGWDPTDIHTDNFYQELANSTLAEQTETHDVILSSSPKYLWFEWYGSIVGSSTLPLYIQTGDGTDGFDTGNNYSVREAINGQTDLTFTNTTRLRIDNTDTTPIYLVGFAVNVGNNEKLFIIHLNAVVNDATNTAVNRIEFVGKWSNTENPIDRLRIGRANADVAAGSRWRVFGGN